jgi:hypothetical protein
MGDISLTAKEIRPLPGAVVQRFNAGGTLTPGQSVYIASDGDVEAVDADALGTSQVRGIVVSDGIGSLSFAAGVRVDVVLGGPISGYASMTQGAIVYNSANAGKLDHTAPAGAGKCPCVAGYAMTDTILMVQPQTAIPVANGA